MLLKLIYLILLIRNSLCIAISSNNFDFIHSTWNGNKFNTLIFEGGGVRAVVYSGAIKKLEEVDMIKDINCIAGTSSGAQTAALLCTGYNSKELEDALRNAPWDKIFHGNILNIKCIYLLFSKFGLNNGIYLEKYLDYLIFKKIGIRHLTFEELYNKTKIHLKIGVCSLKCQEFKYIDHLTYPDMPVSKGLRASSSIPFILSSTKWKDELFIDGGLIGNLPITSFPENNCLAITLSSNYEFNLEKKNPKNIFSFIRIILNILFKNVQKSYSSENKCINNVNYIKLHTGNIGVLDNLDNKTITRLVNHGYKAVSNFLKN